MVGRGEPVVGSIGNTVNTPALFFSCPSFQAPRPFRWRTSMYAVSAAPPPCSSSFSAVTVDAEANVTRPFLVPNAETSFAGEPPSLVPNTHSPATKRSHFHQLTRITMTCEIGTIVKTFSKILSNSAKSPLRPPNLYSHNSAKTATTIRPVTPEPRQGR